MARPPLNPLLVAWCALAGCAPVDAPPEARAEGPLRVVAGGLTHGTSALVAGQPATFAVTGASPGETVYFARSGGLGSGPCLGPLGGLCLDLDGSRTKLLGVATADGNGVASLGITLPAQAEGLTLATQAAIARGNGGVDSVKSNTLLQVVGAPEVGLADIGPGDLVIGEIMQNPAMVDDTTGEWFEITNPTPAAIDLLGLEVTDNGVDAFTVGSSVVVPAGGQVVLGRSADTLANGGADVDYVFSGMALANADDELILSYGAVVFDEVWWDGGPDFPDPNGASMSLDPTLVDADANDAGTAWCASTWTFGLGDMGSPGAANPSCGGVPGDADGDGHAPPADCDDADPDVHPGAPELCNGFDDDCDGSLAPAELDGNGDGTPDCLDTGTDCAASPYDETTGGLTGQALWDELADLTQAQTCTNYSEASDWMFVTLDKVNGQVECVYTGTLVTVGNQPPDPNFMNTEHTWPQSQGTDRVPAKCDLHHLYPTLSSVNSARGNYPFGEVVDVITQFPGGSKLGDDAFGDRVFEPRHVHKGNVARSMVYMATRHGFTISPAQMAIYQSWHGLDPVDADELDRTWDIADHQVLPNPYVVCEQFLDLL